MRLFCIILHALISAVNSFFEEACVLDSIAGAEVGLELKPVMERYLDLLNNDMRPAG